MLDNKKTDSQSVRPFASTIAYNRAGKMMDQFEKAEIIQGTTVS